MQQFEINVDFNGIIIFDPERLQHYYSGIEAGTNLYRKFTTTEDGDEVVKQGILVPIMGINDSTYPVIVRMADEESLIPEDLIVLSNSAFPLHVKGRAVIADMEVLMDWDVGPGWQDIAISPGLYSVAINGFRKIVEDKAAVYGYVVAKYGFEVVLTPTNALPECTGSLTKDMQVNALPDEYFPSP
ncbi:hypothetical protein [Massilia aquatica]|uniref:Uncharacterized protein n=1 Tax=Massilia aquatica TaxID=2609000 RepID=A0ABX0M2P9_9BURK|nr:hypothetical protein [Massilia aquatica]NHZ40524.1 hypothetical protein [Massilia aquatica]